MAHPVAPMDIDNIDSDFDNKENTFHHNNVQPCTEKGYEELDVSELNMRLRYSVTPAASPMSKSYTSYVDNKSFDSDDSLNITVNDNLTRSLNATITKNDNVVKSLKSLPLQSLPTDQSVERNGSVLRQLDSTKVVDNNNITVTISGTNDIDENLSLPSSSSSAVPTPEATTPTKEIPKSDGGSPIMRGLKSVLNMFRSSQSPIPPPDHENNTPKQLTPTPTKRLSSEPREKVESKPVLASTPIASHRDRDANGSKRNSPLKDSITFNDDLEKELQWKDETTILFSQEKIPIHKLFYQQKQNKIETKTSEIKTEVADNFDTTVEYMDISFNDSQIKDRTMTEVEQEVTKNDFHVASESDSEFLDCETEANVTKTESCITDSRVGESVKEESIGVQKPAKDITFSQENQGTPEHINEIKKVDLNVTVPFATVPQEEIIEDKLYASLCQNINIAISNNLNKTDTNLDIKIEADDNVHQVKIEKEQCEVISELNLDVTMTMDDQENKNKSINNMLDVSTLESHTKSLSSLIESLDVTKSFDEEKANIDANNTFDITTTFDPNADNFETSDQEIKATDKPAEILNEVSSLNGNETCSEVANILETDAVKLQEGAISSPIQVFNVTMNMDNQEHVFNMHNESIKDLTMPTSTVQSLQPVTSHEVSQSFDKTHMVEVSSTARDTTFNISKDTTTEEMTMPTPKIESVQEIASQEALSVLPTSTVQYVQDMSTHEASQLLDKTHTVEATSSIRDTNFDISKDTPNQEMVMTITKLESVQEIMRQEVLQVIDNSIAVDPTPMESPADAPLPEDDDIDKDVIVATDFSDLITDNTLSLIDNKAAETPDQIMAEVTVDVVSETKCDDRHLPDMLLETKDFNNDSETIIPPQVEIVPSKEEVTNIENVNLEDCIVADIQCQNQNDTAVNEIQNIDKTHVQTANLNYSVDSSQTIPDVINQSMIDGVAVAIVAPNSESIDNLENGINNKDANVSTNYGKEQNNIQNNIDSTILPEIQMETSISVCEEILDKNREISEMFLTEQKIDKLQHANDVALSYQDVKSESLSLCQNINKNEMLSDINIVLNDDITEANQPKINIDNTLDSQDTNKTITLEKQAEIASDQQKAIPEQEKMNTEDVKIEEVVSDQNEIAKINVTYEEDKKINLLEKCNIELEFQGEGNNIVQLDKLADNVTTTIEDITIAGDEQKDVIIRESKLGHNMETMENGNGDGKECLPMNLNDGFPDTTVIAVAEDEVIVSGNNSPYVSVAADLDKILEEKPSENFEEIENPFATQTNIPSSPPISSKGYNFNFDEIDDPFATKVKIRMSPGPDSPDRNVEIKKEDTSLPKSEPFKKDINKNRRRSQPARQKLSNMKKVLNATVDGSATVTESNKNKISTSIKTQQKPNEVTEEKQITFVDSLNDTITIPTILSNFDQNIANNIPEIKTDDVVDADMKSDKTLTEDKPNDIPMCEENKDSLESITATTYEIKTTSSSEQSTYYSAGTSSNDSMKSRNVFNLPEIDDMNFNPFATKSKVRQSPPRDVDTDPFANKSKVLNSPDSSMIMQQDNVEKIVNTTINIENKCTEKHLEDKMETEPMEKDTSANISNGTNSSKGTDKDITIREVNTEDEDTIEGPFLEAEDIDDKQSDFDGENVDMMQFNDLPVPEHDENADGELFIDAEAFEFLLNQNKSNVVADSGKESLFLKFDPLFAKRMSSDSVVAALSRAQKRQSTPTRTPRQPRNLAASVAGPSAMNLTFEADPSTTEATEDVNTTVTKPMMVVTPAVNPTATLRKSVTPTRSNRRSITFTSPAMAVIDRLLSLSANNSFAEQQAVPQVSREQNEAEMALTQLREVLAEKEIHVYNLRSESKELKDRLTTLESQMKLLETEGQQRLKKINDLNEKLSEKTQMNKSMAVVVEEYERTIASLIAETEQDKKRHAEERIALMNERDEQTAHLASMEVSFNDLHSKYEKSKQVIMNYKANEESYKQSLKEFEENVSKMQKNYELLKQHATSKLNHANEELQKLNRSHEAEVLKLNAMIKRKDLHITSLEETLAQKTKANEELTAICDELINKVG